MKVTYETLMAQIQALQSQLTGTAAPTARIIHRRRKPEAKYVDPASGQAWAGRGKTPLWLKAAMAAGKAKEDFAVASATVAVANASAEKTIRTRRKPTAKFVDASTGNAWSGRGKTPVWLREAINAGMSKEQFAVAA